MALIIRGRCYHCRWSDGAHNPQGCAGTTPEGSRERQLWDNGHKRGRTTNFPCPDGASIYFKHGYMVGEIAKEEAENGAAW